MKGLPKVLFVDDQAEVLEDLKVSVSDLCDPFSATTSEEGLEIFEKEGPFTVVVSDQILPGMDGSDFLARVIRRDPHVSTMLLTGHANYSDAMTAVNEGHVFRLLEKPYSPAALREAYGDDNFGQGLLLARRLVERQVRFVEVQLGGWDTHQNNFTRVPERTAILDQALSSLLDDLSKRGMLDETLVVLATEFGRTPNINVNEGRDHYPKAFSCMLAGGGIRGGQVWGKTDDEGREVIDQRVEIPDLNATIAYCLGLPLDEIIYSPTRRPFTLSDKGQPLTKLV